MTSTCPFCNIIEDNPEYLETNGVGVYYLEPLNPVVPGHRIFIAKDHFAKPHQGARVVGNLFAAAAFYGGQQNEDYNLIVNAGRDASQTVPHVHVHYVPRREGDGLTLPWTGQTQH